MAKKNKRRTLFWLVLAVIIIIAAGFYNRYVNNKPEAGHNYTVENTGAGLNIDFTAAARRIHQAVDDGLTAAGLPVRDVKEIPREVPRRSVEGMLHWPARQILTGPVADGDRERIRAALAGAVKTAGAEILAVQADHYQGKPVTRLDIGLHDQLAGEPVTIITDQLYLPGNGPAVPGPAGPAGRIKGKLAVIIDDFGYSREPINAFAAIDRPLTFSVLPYRPYSNDAAARGLSSGHQVMLHLPLEPIAAGEQSENNTITTAMSDQEIRETVSRAIQAVPGIIGVNNHQGSKATADRRVMRVVLSVLKDNSLFFVDSRTSSQSVAYDTARRLALRTGQNILFLDNSSDVGYIKAKLRAAGDSAVRNGAVIVIGHARLTTAEALRAMIPELEAGGVQLVFVGDIVR